MARKLRVDYPGALYHVMSRGDHREPIFGDDRDRECFVETLGQACLKTGWQVQAYCLMPNHFHLVVETPQGGISLEQGELEQCFERPGLRYAGKLDKT